MGVVNVARDAINASATLLTPTRARCDAQAAFPVRLSPSDGALVTHKMDAWDALRALARESRLAVVASEVQCSFLTDAYPDEALKEYAIERKTIGSTLTASACAWRAVRCAVVAFQRPVQEWLNEVDARITKETETGEPSELPEFDYIEPTRAAWWAFKRDSGVAATRRILEYLVVGRSSKRLSAKLCKDIRYSARRKAQRVSWERGLGKFAQAGNMFRTVTLANAINVSGEFVVDVTLASYEARWLRRRSSKASSRAISRAWRRALLRAACKAGSVLVGGAAACAAFTFCRPRGAGPRVVSWGTYASLTAGELAGGIFIAPTVFALVADANVEEPPPAIH